MVAASGTKYAGKHVAVTTSDATRAATDAADGTLAGSKTVAETVNHT
jgi:hypothetical protein